LIIIIYFRLKNEKYKLNEQAYLIQILINIKIHSYPKHRANGQERLANNNGIILVVENGS
jgi:hypothetical protein